MVAERAMVERQTGEIIESRPVPVKLTEEAIAITVSNIQMAEKLVFKVLEKGVDYGRLPGLPGESLFDPGAQKIANAFNTYPKHNVLFHQETDELISYTIEAQLISRDSQQVVGSGIGASSTMEPKNKYRWVRDPREFGYSEEETATLKTRTDEREGEEYDLYRILNPEYGELVNTIAQMSAKRAEVDAAKSLPGVGSALKKLFTGKQRGELDWNSFWANAKNMGLNSDQVHAILNVKSLKEWTAAGKGLNDAIRAISEHLAKGKAAAGPTAPPKSQIKPREEWDNITEQMVPNYPTLERVFYDLTKMQPKQMYQELGGGGKSDMTVPPWQLFLTLKERYAPANEK